MKKGKNKFKIPNFLIYGILQLASKLISKFEFNLKIEKNEIKKLKGPYVVIANHESSIDFINMVCATNKRITFVISNSFYQSLKIHKLIKMAGVIAKQQFQTNPSDLKKMKEAISAKRPLVIYPAGLMTANGVATPIPEATGKFIKWLGVDVYVAKTDDTQTIIQKEEIEDYIWLTYENAYKNLKFENDKTILHDAREHLISKGLITSEEV